MYEYLLSYLTLNKFQCQCLDRHYSGYRGRHPQSSSRRRHRRRRSPMSHRAASRRYFVSRYSSGDEDDEGTASGFSDERYGSGRKESESLHDKRSSKSKHSSRSRSPIPRGGGKRAGEASAANDGKRGNVLPTVVDKKQTKIVEFFTRKSVKKSAPAATTREAATKSPAHGNSPNETSPSKGHKRKTVVASPQLPKRLKHGGSTVSAAAANTSAVSSPSAPVVVAGVGSKAHPDRLKQVPPSAAQIEAGQDGTIVKKEK